MRSDYLKVSIPLSPLWLLNSNLPCCLHYVSVMIMSVIPANIVKLTLHIQSRVVGITLCTGGSQKEVKGNSRDKCWNLCHR